MAVPTWEQFMVPALQVLADGEVHQTRHIVEHAANELGVTEAQRAIRVPSGKPQYLNRAWWALATLVRIGAAEQPERAQYRITETGQRLLTEHPSGLTEGDLRALVQAQKAPDAGQRLTDVVTQGLQTSNSTVPDLDPVEQIAVAIQQIDAHVASQLLARIMAREPAFFEQIVLDLLMAMGYGGTEGAATRTQLAGDGGVDGIIDQDALGLSRVYVQAKRYASENTVGRPTVQGFAGALAGVGATQGVFITTSKFSAEAMQYAEHLPTRIVLIDGARLTTLMIRFRVGVQVKQAVQILEVDEDYFEQE